MCTARFRHLWRWDGSESVLMSRAVDETGYVQPTYAELVAARGPRTSYHQNNIRPWKVRSDGTLGFALGDTL
jgi:sulfane dehydrogenase subunit SoxC